MLDNARDLIGLVRDESVRAEWLGALPSDKAGTAKVWFQDHHGATVDTLQVTVLSDGTLRNGWAPTGRVIDSKTRATQVSFDESSRDYQGMRVEAVSDDCLVASTSWGDDRQLVIYKVVKS